MNNSIHLAEYKNFPLKCLSSVGFKTDSESPNTVQRMVHCQWQTRKSSALSEINNAKSPEEAEVSRDSTFPKRLDSLRKVGANVSGDGGIENAVTNAASIGSEMHRLFPYYQNFDLLATFIRANSFLLFLQSRKPSLISHRV